MPFKGVKSLLDGSAILVLLAGGAPKRSALALASIGMFSLCLMNLEKIGLYILYSFMCKTNPYLVFNSSFLVSILLTLD